MTHLIKIVRQSHKHAKPLLLLYIYFLVQSHVWQANQSELLYTQWFLRMFGLSNTLCLEKLHAKYAKVTKFQENWRMHGDALSAVLPVKSVWCIALVTWRWTARVQHIQSRVQCTDFSRQPKLKFVIVPLGQGQGHWKSRSSDTKRIITDEFRVTWLSTWHKHSDH